MLTENIWTERGLVNGAVGTVVNVAWSPEADFLHDSPSVIFVMFDEYDGPSMDIDGQPGAPMFLSKREFIHNGASCSRIQFPLTPAYAITIHKSQGLTLPQVVLNLSEADFTPGLTYVAISRVKTLEGLMFEDTIDYSHFRKSVGADTIIMRQQDIERRRELHVQPNDQ